MATALSDRCMSRSLARAGDTDSILLQELAAQEDAAANDRALAQRVILTGDRALVAFNRTTARTPPTQHPISKIKLESPALNTWETNMFVANQTSARSRPIEYSVSENNGQSVAQQSGVADDVVSFTSPVDSYPSVFKQMREENTTAKTELDPLTGPKQDTVEDSTTHTAGETEDGEIVRPPRQSVENKLKRKLCECVACSEEVADSEVMRTLCDHDYCRSCLNMLFKLSTTNEALFHRHAAKKRSLLILQD